MTIDCYICKSVVFDGFVTCAGHCNRVAHYPCAAITKEAYIAICKHPSVKWFCSECNNVDLSSIDKKISLLADTIANLKNANQNIPCSSIQDVVAEDVVVHRNDSVGTLKQPNDADPPTPTYRVTRSSAKTFQTGQAKKKVAASKSTPSYSGVVKDGISDESASGELNPQNQSDNTTLNLDSNSNSMQTNGIIGTSASNILQSVVLRRPEKWVYVSRLSPTTTTEQIKEFFSTTFNSLKQDIYVTKIVPRDRDPSTMSYISFKIGCTSDIFKDVLCSEKWPVGIFVKEFVLKNGFTLQPRPNP